MTDIELLTYLLMFMLSIFFSSLAINREGPTFSFLSWLTWHMFAVLHLVSAYTSNFLVMVWLFFGLGTIFLVLALVKSFQQLRLGRQRREMELV